MTTDKNVVIGRLYGLVGTVVRTEAGQLQFLTSACDLNPQAENAVKRVAERVNNHAPLPTHWTHQIVVSPQYDANDLRVIAEAVCIYTEGQLLMVEEANYLANLNAVR